MIKAAYMHLVYDVNNVSGDCYLIMFPFSLFSPRVHIIVDQVSKYKFVVSITM